MIHEAPQIRCYFDADCGFCTRMVDRVRRLAGLPEEAIVPAQSDPAIFEIMERENSWIVIDGQGERRLRWAALAFVLGQRRALRPIAWLMRAPVLTWAGDRFYRWIADHRGSF